PLESAPRLRFKRRHHRVPSLADRYHQYSRIRIEVVQVFANAQQATLATHMARECTFNRRVFERGSEDVARNLAHPPELLVAQRLSVRHRGDYGEMGCDQ